MTDQVERKDILVGLGSVIGVVVLVGMLMAPRIEGWHPTIGNLLFVGVVLIVCSLLLWLWHDTKQRLRRERATKTLGEEDGRDEPAQ